MLPPEAIKPFLRLLDVLEKSGEKELPEEWRGLLTTLFPEIAEAESEATLDTLAATLKGMFEREVKKNDGF